MKNYLVTLIMEIGEYEKTSFIIVEAEDEDKAGSYAIYAETHHTDTMEWDEDCNGAYDDFGGMYYAVESFKFIKEEELKVMKKYIPVVKYNQSNLDVAGDYKEKIK